LLVGKGGLENLYTTEAPPREDDPRLFRRGGGFEVDPLLLCSLSMTSSSAFVKNTTWTDRDNSDTDAPSTAGLVHQSCSALPALPSLALPDDCVRTTTGENSPTFDDDDADGDCGGSSPLSSFFTLKVT
jgi:hypothetical protein